MVVSKTADRGSSPLVPGDACDRRGRVDAREVDRVCLESKCLRRRVGSNPTLSESAGEKNEDTNKEDAQKRGEA